MNAISIHCSEQSLSQSARGVITGSLWILFHGKPFPSHGWNDFVPVVLLWWLEEISKLSEKNKSCRLRFMDGPYWTSVSLTEEGTLLLRAIEDRSEEVILTSAEVEASCFINELVIVAKKVCLFCDLQGWKNKDLFDLSSAVKRTALPNKSTHH